MGKAMVADQDGRDSVAVDKTVTRPLAGEDLDLAEAARSAAGLGDLRKVEDLDMLKAAWLSAKGSCRLLTVE